MLEDKNAVPVFARDNRDFPTEIGQKRATWSSNGPKDSATRNWKKYITFCRDPGTWQLDPASLVEPSTLLLLLFFLKLKTRN